MKGEVNSNTIIVGNFNTPFTPMDRSTKQKISKETQTLNDTMDQLNLVDIYRTFHPKTMNITFFSSAHRNFLRIDHILGNKSSLGKFKKSLNHLKDLFWSHCSKIICQCQGWEETLQTNIFKLSNTLLNNQQITEEIKFDPWVGKIPWRREQLPTLVFWPGEIHELYNPWVYKKWTKLSDSLCPVATGLEKVSFHANPKERQCQRMSRLLHNCTHLYAGQEATVRTG